METSVVSFRLPADLISRVDGYVRQLAAETSLSIKRTEVVAMLLRKAVDSEALAKWLTNVSGTSPRVLIATHEPDGKKLYVGFVGRNDTGESYVTIRRKVRGGTIPYGVPRACIFIWEDDGNRIDILRGSLENTGYREVTVSGAD